METYVVHPPQDKANGHIVLYYPDVFGFFTNGLLIMDELADAGYLVLGIDYFQGVRTFLLVVMQRVVNPVTGVYRRRSC